MTKKRLTYIDALKGFIILWVALYHVLYNTTIPGADFVLVPYRMPLFFMMSGFFFRETSSFKEFSLKKINTLIVPFFFFLLVYYIFQLALLLVPVLLGDKSITDILTILAERFATLKELLTLTPIDSASKLTSGIGPIWFLLALVEIQLLYYGLRKICKSPLFLIAIALGFSLLYTYYLEENYASRALFFGVYATQYVLYYVIGHLFMHKFVGLINQGFKQKLSVIGVSSILLSVFTLSTFADMKPMLILEVLFFSAIMITLFSILPERLKLVSILSYYGRNSLIVLGTHMLIITVCRTILSNFFSITDLNLTLTIAVFLMIAIASVPVIFIFNKYFPKFVAKSRLIK